MKKILAVSALALLAAGSVHAADLDRHFSINGDRLVLVNLVGEVKVEPATGSSFEVDVAVRGKDATADLVRFDQADGADAHLCVQFPLGKEDKFVYPGIGHFSDSSFEAPRGSNWGDSPEEHHSFLGKRSHQVKVKGSGRGLEAWADVTVRVPAGRKLELRIGAGQVTAIGTQADLVLDSCVGSVVVEGTKGTISVDTGTGVVSARNTDGDLAIDTGSGNVTLERCRGGRLGVDTGSGSVEATDIGADDLSIDTGSGRVEVTLARMGKGDFVVDTGSGSIDFQVPPGASADITADSGTGGVSLDLAAAKVQRHDDDEMTVKLGDGEASVTLDTGSGAIRITQ
jgi:hypothetical protein